MRFGEIRESTRASNRVVANLVSPSTDVETKRSTRSGSSATNRDGVRVDAAHAETGRPRDGGVRRVARGRGDSTAGRAGREKPRGVQRGRDERVHDAEVTRGRGLAAREMSRRREKTRDARGALRVAVVRLGSVEHESRRRVEHVLTRFVDAFRTRRDVRRRASRQRRRLDGVAETRPRAVHGDEPRRVVSRLLRRVRAFLARDVRE